MKLVFWILLISLFSSLLGMAGQDQKRGRKPVLIRADQTEEEENKVIIHDPELAKKSVQVGDYYFKRKNYSAAEKRYREAIEYNRKWPESYEKLIKTLEEKDEFEAALEICQLFSDNNPTSDKVKDFTKKAEKLKEQLTPEK